MTSLRSLATAANAGSDCRDGPRCAYQESSPTVSVNYAQCCAAHRSWLVRPCIALRETLVALHHEAVIAFPGGAGVVEVRVARQANGNVTDFAEATLTLPSISRSRAIATSALPAWVRRGHRTDRRSPACAPRCRRRPCHDIWGRTPSSVRCPCGGTVIGEQR
jgi:hypothetical protein